jgi:hypothetical protein
MQQFFFAAECDGATCVDDAGEAFPTAAEAGFYLCAGQDSDPPARVIPNMAHVNVRPAPITPLWRGSRAA